MTGFGLFGFGEAFEHFAVNVEVADLAGGAAEFREGADEGARLLAMLGEAGDEGQEEQERFDAASFGAELVDGLVAGVGEADRDGGFESGDVLAENLYRKGCGGTHIVTVRLAGATKALPAG